MGYNGRVGASRKIVGLRWAQAMEAPRAEPKGRKGAKAQGLRFERQVVKALPGCLHGQWFKFEDINGLGWCQTDILTLVNGLPTIIEVKLTACEAGYRQLEELYRPVVEYWLKQKVGLVQVSKNLCPGVKDWVDSGNCTLIDNLDSIHQTNSPRFLLPWLGFGKLGTHIDPWALRDAA